MTVSNGNIRKRVYHRDGRAWTRFVATIELEPGGERSRRSASFDRERDARRWLAEQRSRAESGVALSADVPTVGTLLAEWLQHGTGTKGWSPSHTYRCESIVRVDLASLARVPADRLSVRDVEAILDRKRAAGASPDTVRLVRAALRAALNLAIRRGVLTRNVATLAQTPAPRRTAPRFLSQDEALTLLAALDRERLGPLFKVALGLALRPSEAIGLRWEDVDFDTRVIRVEQGIQLIDGTYQVRRPKTERSRRAIPFPIEIGEILREQKVSQLEERVQALRWDDSGLVFTNRHGGPVYPPYPNRRLQRILQDLGLKRVTFQELRHTGATLLLAMGAELAAIQDLLGHTSINTTRRYAQVVEPLKRDATELMGPLFRKVAPSVDAASSLV